MAAYDKPRLDELQSNYKVIQDHHFTRPVDLEWRQTTGLVKTVVFAILNNKYNLYTKEEDPPEIIFMRLI